MENMIAEKLLGLLLCAIIVASEQLPVEEEDGYLTTYSGIGLRYDYHKMTLESIGYPNPVLQRAKQTWRYVIESYLGPDVPQALKLQCYDIRLKNNNPCKDYMLTIEDGKVTKQLCGIHNDFTYVSKTRDVYIKLLIDGNEGGYLNCTAELIHLDENGQQLTTTTTTPPPPTKPAYLNQEILNVDSREHGLGGGSIGTNCRCGWTNKANTRIVGGRETLVHEYPWAVTIIWTDKDENVRSTPFCGGSIITEWHILTAAHCTRRNGPLDDLIHGVVVGEHNWKEYFQSGGKQGENAAVHKIERIFKHEDYNRGLIRNDISLLLVHKKIEFTQNVGPVCLLNNRLNLDGELVKGIGWGNTKYQGNSSPVLKTAHLKVIPFENCSDIHSIIDKENRHQFCTFAHDEGTCNGDSGGPIVRVNPETNFYDLVGLVSFGRVCAKEPSGHVEVSAFMGWIYERIRDSGKFGNICQALRG